MCWAYRIADVGIRAAATEIAEPHLGRIVSAGRAGPILTRRGGQYAWIETRYGMMLPGERGVRNLAWNARDDRLEQVETWSRLFRQRYVCPVSAYAETANGERWHTGEPAFMIGLYDLAVDGGAVAITEQHGDERPPVLVSRADAARWLEAPQWEVMATLRSMARRRFSEADLFEGKRLGADARSRVPVSRKAA